MRGLMLLLLLAGAAQAADNTQTPPASNTSMSGMNMSSMNMGNMKMGNMNMGSNTPPDAQHCAEMRAQSQAGTLPADMKSMLSSCPAAPAAMPAATQDR